MRRDIDRCGESADHMSFVSLLPSQRGLGGSSVLLSSGLLPSGSKKRPQHQKDDSSVKSTLSGCLPDDLLALLTRLRYCRTVSSANKDM